MRFALLVALLATARLAAQTCDGLSVLGVAQDPFQADRIRLISLNDNPVEIYSYPGWRMVDADGNLLAEEVVNYFGIYGQNLHDLVWQGPGEVPEEAVEVTLELWTGFYESLVCTVPYTFEARSFEWSNAAAGECLPVRLALFGYAPPEATAEVTLASLGWAGEFWSTTLTVNEANGWSTLSDSLCLAQNDCYTLEVTFDAEANVSMYWSDAGLGFTHALWQLSEPGTTVTTWDLYGGDCVTGVAEAASELPTVPATRTGEPLAAAGLAGPCTVLDRAGRTVSSGRASHLVAPAAPGLYFILTPDGAVHRWSVY